MIKNFVVWVLGLSILTSGCLMPGISLCGINTAIESYPLSGEVTDTKKNVWTPQDEGDHYPCTREWWNIDSFFTCNNKSWSVTASVGYEMETPACNMFFTLFDGESGKYYPFGSFDDPFGTLIHKKDTVDLTYGKSTIQGLYPHYVIHLEDKESNILLDMEFTAKSDPYWVAENMTNGFLPMGRGFYRYGFISNCEVTGEMEFKGEKQPVYGSGYYEHVWGNWSYNDPLLTPRDVGWLYFNLVKWWIEEHSFGSSSSIAFSRDNNPFGYDWIWAIFDNDWSLFYGNIMFWVLEGPVFGVLYLEKDGKYIEFVDITYRYGRMEYSGENDLYYPLEIILEARNKDYVLALHFNMTAERNEYIDRFQGRHYWKGLGLWEAPGRVNGWFTDGNSNISLNGKCEIEPQRLFSPLGHNAITLNFYSGTKGFSLNITSHLTGVEIIMGFHLLPSPRFYFSFRILDKSSNNPIESFK